MSQLPVTATSIQGLHSTPSKRKIPASLLVGFWGCIVIAVAVVVRRLFALAHPSTSAPPPLANLDAAFASHTALTLAHIVPALFFVLVVPVVVFRKSANNPWAERLLYPLGLMVGITAYGMSAYAIGGWVERSATFFFDTLCLFSLVRAFIYWRRGEPVLHRRWLIRAIVILLGIATTRPVMGIFFATSRLTHLTPEQFFGWAFWIGFSINTVAVELWLRRRPASHPALPTT